MVQEKKFVLEERRFQAACSDSGLALAVTLNILNSNRPRESSGKDQEPFL